MVRSRIVFDQRAVDLARVDEVGRAERLGHLELVRVEVDGEDAAGLGHHRALDARQADAAEAEHGDGGAGLDLGGVEHRADAGGDAAAEQADFIQRRRRVDLGERDFRHHGVFGKGRAAHVVEDRLAVLREAAGAVGHVAGPHGGGDRLAQIGLGRGAVFAVAALGDVERDDVVARLQRFDAGAALDHDAAAFVAEDAGECAFGVVARQGEGIGVADAAGDDLQQHLALARAFDFDLFNRQRFLGFPGNGGTSFHDMLLFEMDWNEGSGGLLEQFLEGRFKQLDAIALQGLADLFHVDPQSRQFGQLRSGFGDIGFYPQRRLGHARPVRRESCRAGC